MFSANFYWRIHAICRARWNLCSLQLSFVVNACHFRWENFKIFPGAHDPAYPATNIFRAKKKSPNFLCSYTAVETYLKDFHKMSFNVLSLPNSNFKTSDFSTVQSLDKKKLRFLTAIQIWFLKNFSLKIYLKTISDLRATSDARDIYTHFLK